MRKGSKYQRLVGEIPYVFLMSHKIQEEANYQKALGVNGQLY
jgi:hypothetical protein